MTNRAFMNIVDYNRQKHHITIHRLCEEVGVDNVKDYEYYMKGIKTPPPWFVLAVVKYFGIEEF